MIHIKKSHMLVLIAALSIFAAADYLAATAIGRGYEREGNDYKPADDRKQRYEQELSELQRLREQDSNQLRRHIQLAQVSETISRLDYDAGVAMGGYSITKDPMFYDRFQKIAEELPRQLQRLKALVSTMTEEEATVQSIDKRSTKILDINREAKAMVDDPKVTPDQMKHRHMYKTVRDAADKLEQAINALREKDLSLTNSALRRQPQVHDTALHTPMKSSPQTGSRTHSGDLLIFLLALVNAISGCLILWFLANLQSPTG